MLTMYNSVDNLVEIDVDKVINKFGGKGRKLSTLFIHRKNNEFTGTYGVW
jgi:hypothetical protein